MRRYCSPLRYPGGKGRLAPFIKSLIRENGLDGIDYVEPYAGGAGVALSALFDRYVSRITINDIDRSVYAFWRSVVRESDRFCEAIEKTKVNVETWHIAREIQCDKGRAADMFDLGFSTFFLNRTNVSGVLRGSGVIGGKKQNGPCKINARFNKKTLIERIQKIGKHSRKIKVCNQDSLQLLKKITGPKFVYLDPPYVEKSERLYINSYEKADHLELADFVQRKLHKDISWVTSYDKSAFILRAYRERERLYWRHRYSTSQNPNVKEVIFLSRNLRAEESRKLL
ncbi:MAG: Site-specific DNA-methyltransferase (adenine-specific) [Arenicellales bacterium IbO2]|nr:DNA adenine methylase [Gammaproteobacteria bacterium]MDA8023649.1 DNA adenine methylase [Gammaproteobacteria bacterium]CAJ2376569.1 MAG: Site-specific DNA-methyltransferase (adenine-specific) [Arenicellales bacterium IbO2]